jgi:glutamine synthetase
MRQVASRHHLVCLLHEKPFAGINGSGKHNNWSLCTDSGFNLLSPSTDHSLVFLILLAAILNGVHQHAGLLRASIASAGNDHRLGGHEAPPVIMSVYLGEGLEKMLSDIEENGSYTGFSLEKYDLKIQSLPDLPKDHSDRNRTSPFAFTGSKFEFRAVGASANCALPLTVINVIVAESLNQIMDEIEAQFSQAANSSMQELQHAVLPIIQKYLKASHAIRFSGDNYSDEWRQTAKQRSLPMIEKSFDAFACLTLPSAVKAFENVLSEDELQSRVNILSDRYAKEVHIETKLMVELFRTKILPAAIEYQKQFAESVGLLNGMEKGLGEKQARVLRQLVASIDFAIEQVDRLDQARQQASNLKGHEKKEAFSRQVISLSEQARIAVDQLEALVDDRLWPLAKYRELLWMV